MSQVLTTPASSIEKANPSFDCRLTALIEAEVTSVDSVPDATGSADEALICQNLTDPSPPDAEIRVREEEKTREVILCVCPMRVLTR